MAALVACLLVVACIGGTTTSLPAPTTSARVAPTSSTQASPSTITAASSTTSSIASPTTTATHTPTTAGEDARGAVVRVVDGDTIVVRLFGGELGASASGEGENVRLIGIDAPESGEDFSQEATDALTELVGGQEVDLVLDQELHDQYGRVLAYLFLEDGTMVNAELLRQGVVTLYTVPPNVKYVETLQNAQDEAQAARAGVWGASSPSPLAIVQVNYDPPGDDTLDMNQEYVVVRVLVTGTLKGYAVEDATGHRFDFPDRVLKKGDEITLHSGMGTNTATDLYWGASGSAIWNNDGDTVKVLDPQGHIVQSHTY